MGRGGAEARAMWCLEALKDVFDVSLITTGAVDLDGLNEFYGTAVRAGNFQIRKAPVPFFMDRITGGDAFRSAFFQRFCHKIASEFDLLISTYNFCDFGVPAIQCIADFSWDDEIRESFDPRPSGTRGLFHRNKSIRKVYLKISRLISNPSGRNIFAGEDLILANSKWSAGIIKKKYGVESDVVYPPVTDNFPKVAPAEKKMGFVCISRIFPEKRIERIIDIIKNVRQRGHDVHLHIIGDTSETQYGKSIEELSKIEGDWIILEGKRIGLDKIKILSQHHYGIHARQGEAFGISVAEMVKAGCITFVPNCGGQAEIVNHSSLVYNSIEDAVNKIDTVIRQPQLQLKLQNHLEIQGEKFSANAFIKNIKAAVKRILKRTL